MVKADSVVPGIVRNAHIENPDAIVEHLEERTFLATEDACGRNTAGLC